jgi:hypothetical protein
MDPFDVPAPANRTATFTLPAGLADGTVLHYYCKTHVFVMSPANGTITIDSTATAGPPPG